MSTGKFKIDADGETVTYSDYTGDDVQPFSIDENGRIVTDLQGEIDYETQDPVIVTFTVTATSADGNINDFKDITINVNDLV